MHEISIDELLDRYDAFFIDAYGVLVTTAGALPGAAHFLERIRDTGKRHLILTNDASRLPSTIVERYRRFGIAVSSDEIITSGMLLEPWFRDKGLSGAPTIVLGPADSYRYVEASGGVPVASDDESACVVAACDDDGYEMHATVDNVITTLFRRLDAGLKTELVLPNPDLLYVRGERAYGITSGTIALILEAALELRFPGAGHRFDRLGKPHRPMFETALSKLDIARERVVMIGDQLVTDIRGAVEFGIDSVLVGTGISRVPSGEGSALGPTFTLSSL